MKLRDSILEIVLVVVGVLFAFGVEARWSDRQERSEDAGYLNGVVAELERNTAALRGVIQTAESTLAALDSLPLDTEEFRPEEIARIPRLLWVATSVAQTDISFVALESLTSSLAWSRASSTELQLALSGLKANVEALARSSQQSTTYYFDSVEPFLRDRVSFEEWEVLAAEAGAPSFSPDWEAVVSERRFQNVLTHQRWFSEVMLRQARAALTQVEQTVVLINQATF